MKNEQTPNLNFFTQRNKNGNSLIWKLSREHNVIRKAVLLSNGFKDDFQSVLRSLSNLILWASHDEMQIDLIRYEPLTL